jgi:imidazolonepropionase
VSGAVAIEGADEVLLPPETGLPYLRGDRCAEVRRPPGGVTVVDGRIAALEPDPASASIRIDARGCALLPGLVDCHTHLPFAGWRAEEYAMKVAGASYEAIARAGGGIRSSAAALAGAGDDDVLAQAGALASEMLAHGTTTFECKSGYGLSVAGELRQLRLAAELGREVVQRTAVTALVAHAVPPGWDADAWLDAVEAAAADLGAAGPLAALDAYVESVAFTNEHLERVGRLAGDLGLALRAHVEQFATHRSVPVAIDAGARSVDHLACLHPDDVPVLAAAECAAVLLPGAELLGAERVAPARALADAGAICVLATDANPGTSPIVSLPLIAAIAVRRYGFTVTEALVAMTLNAAWVLGMAGEIGSVEVGKRADLTLIDVPLDHVPYRFGHNPVALVLRDGEPVYVREDARWRLT